MYVASASVAVLSRRVLHAYLRPRTLRETLSGRIDSEWFSREREIEQFVECQLVALHGLQYMRDIAIE